MDTTGVRTGETGTFMLSFDCEGKWGVVDCLAKRHHELYTTANLESTYRRLASLLGKYGIDATFAFTAAFSLTANRFRRMRPQLEVLNTGAQAWMGSALASIERDKGQGWFAPGCFDLTREWAGHEIGCHGFSHIPWHAPYATREVLKAEVELCRSIPSFGADSVQAFVFPRNQVAHTDLLATHGFVCYRAPRRSRGRAANLASEFNLLSPSEQFRLTAGTPMALPAGYFLNWRHGLRRCVPAAVTVRRWKHAVHDAVRNGGVVHAWTHPENFVDGHGMFAMLEGILRIVAEERDAGRLQVLTNSRFIAKRQESTAATPAGVRASSGTTPAAAQIP